jgi:hypothetical protein
MKIKTSRLIYMFFAVFLIFSLIYLNTKAQATTYYYTGVAPGNTMSIYMPFSAIGLTNDPSVASVEIRWISPLGPGRGLFGDTITTCSTATYNGQTEYHFISPSHSLTMTSYWTLEFFFRNAEGATLGQDTFYINGVDPPGGYQITLHTSPAAVGSITFNSVTYTDGQTTSCPTQPMQFTVSANAPVGWVFDHWEKSGSVQISSSTSNPIQVWVTGQCTIEAVFTLNLQNTVPETPFGPFIASITLIAALIAFATLKILQFKIPLKTK